MEAIMAILPPLPQRIISFATAWAVMKTPVNAELAGLVFRLYSEAFKLSSLTSNVDLEHHVGVRLSVIEGRGFLLNASCCDESIESSLCITDALDNCVKALHVSDVDLAVVESIAWDHVCQLES
jgi:hypothetical protein